MKIVLMAIIIILTQADDFYYTRVLDCLTNNTKQCTYWKETSRLNYYTYYATYCFSENTYVLTSQGPKPMRQLIVGDQILAIDPQTATKIYSKIEAWLHRDEDALVQYQIIATEQGPTFESSDYHNIAVVDEAAKINFKFAKDLTAGDKLVGFPVQSLTVSSASVHQEKRGLFSPFTAKGNYFIFDSNFDPEKGSEQPMILAHCLSQISDPTSQLATAERLVSLWSYFGLNGQPEPGVHYVHPLYSKFSFMFGTNWQGQPQRVKYSFVQQYTDARNKSYNNHYKSSSSSNSEKHRDQMKGLGLSISVTQQTIMF